jgi:pyruvate ferredoxin oxidoreductase delta subunit
MLRQQEKHMKKRNADNLMGPVATVFAANKTGPWRLERPVVDFDNCIKCGTCEKYCPADVITVNKAAKECVKFNFDYCKGCGICANECPKKCIVMLKERGE